MLTLKQLAPGEETIALPLDEDWPENPILDGAALQGLLVEGTVIATDAGWRPVETLRPGDRVLTYQNGFRPLRAVTHDTLSPEDDDAGLLSPLIVGADLLGNVTPMPVLPGQIVLCDTDAEGEEKSPELVEARALAGQDDVRARGGSRALTLTRLAFDAPQLVCANYGAILMCPARAVADADFDGGDAVAGGDGENFYPAGEDEPGAPLLGMLDEEADSRAQRDEAA